MNEKTDSEKVPAEIGKLYYMHASGARALTKIKEICQVEDFLNTPRGQYMLIAYLSNRFEGTYLGSFHVISARCSRFVEGNLLQIPLQNRNGVTNFSQEKMQK